MYITNVTKFCILLCSCYLKPFFEKANLWFEHILWFSLIQKLYFVWKAYIQIMSDGIGKIILVGKWFNLCNVFDKANMSLKNLSIFQVFVWGRKSKQCYSHFIVNSFKIENPVFQMSIHPMKYFQKSCILHSKT